MMGMEDILQYAGRERIANGTLKWFSPRYGYGFIVDDETGDDIMLGMGQLNEFGWETVAAGSRIDATCVETPRGLQVSEIVDIVAPSELDDTRVFGFGELDYLSNDFVPARVVWYDEDRGYGFASTYGDAENCFLHWTALAEVGLTKIERGETIAIRIGRGKRGRVAASVRAPGYVQDGASSASHAPSLVAA